jgi:hypothetical protein
MITLTLDKLVRGGKGLEERSDPQGTRTVNTKMDHPSQESYTPPGKAVQGHTGLYSATGWDDVCQKPLFFHLSATVHRSVQGAA